MQGETKTNLSDNTIDALQRLTQLSIDSRNGLNEAAEHLESESVAMILRELARQRNDQVSELRTLVSANFEEPESGGSVMAAAHRTWIDLRAALGGGGSAVLTEAERGEKYILAQYEQALQQTSGSPVGDVLQRHIEMLQSSRDRVSAALARA